MGILSQAWPKEQGDVWQSGLGVAHEVLDKLRAAKRTKEAEEFNAELDRAVARDCMIIVTWTGEADLDLLVEEPSGTVCSLRCPRTIAGGVMLGDVIARPAATTTAATARPTFAPRASTGPTGCWSSGCGAM